MRGTRIKEKWSKLKAKCNTFMDSIEPFFRMHVENERRSQITRIEDYEISEKVDGSNITLKMIDDIFVPWQNDDKEKLEKI